MNNDQITLAAVNTILYILGCGLMIWAFGWTIGIGVACLALFLREDPK